MSRGKFIPGGSRKDREAPSPAKAKAAASEAAAAPEEGAPAAATAPEPAAGKGGAGKGGKGGKGGRPAAKPLDAKKKYMYIAGGALVALYLGYAMFIAPGIKAEADLKAKQAHDAQIAADAEKKRLADEQAQKDAEAKRLQLLEDAKSGPFEIETTPAGADVTIGTETKKSPAKFEGLPSGPVEIKVALAKFVPVTQTVKLEPKKELKLPITLQPLPGKLDIATGTTGADFTVTGPNGYKKDGKAPASISDLPVGEYTVEYKHRGWALPAQKVKVESEATAKAEATFPYASVKLTVNPSAGAVIRDKTGVQILAKDFTGPFELKEVRPGTFDFLIERFGYKMEHVTVTATEGQHLEKTVDLTKSPDFETSFGMQMVWVPAINGWAGRYEVTQKEYEDIMKATPSSTKGNKAKLPVDSVGFFKAMEFCDKATKAEASSGKLPGGYRFTLPSNKQFDILVAGTDLDNASTSRNKTDSLKGSQEVGASAPNPLGLYDVIGNVNEWVTDPFDPTKPDVGCVRGGNFLSNNDSLPSTDRRWPFWKVNLKAAPDSDGKRPPFEADRFIGFRVILVK
ncbi:MAG: PEGA domain-containing protein [Candidatus Methylacidiphilales bacterium]|nr:PEGA domain-containing protein [Candidatus Methylacidiphilales bacterium]